MNRMVLLASLAAVLTGLSLQPAAARTPFDGSWSVLIVTERGACEPAYRSSVSIVDGIVSGSDGMANVYGRVGRGGSVAVRVSSGGAQAAGSGRLGRFSGGGGWRGYGSTGECSGRWSAQRH